MSKKDIRKKYKARKTTKRKLKDSEIYADIYSNSFCYADKHSIDMEDKIYDIVTDLLRYDISKDEAIEMLADLHKENEPSK